MWSKLDNLKFSGYLAQSYSDFSNTSFYSIDMLSSTQSWAVGKNGIILSTNKTGYLWEKQESYTITNLNSVKFISATQGCIVGDSGVILTTTNGGLTWATQSKIVSSNLTHVYFLNQNTGYCVGASGRILITTNRGLTWATQSSGITNQLNNIHFSQNSLYGCAVGNSGTILTTIDGTNWLTRSISLTSNLNSVYLATTQSYWAVGNSSTILKSTDSGVTWATQSAPAPSAGTNTNNRNFNDVLFISATQGYIIASDGDVITTIDGGITWLNTRNTTTGISTTTPLLVKNNLYSISSNGQYSYIAGDGVLLYSNSNYTNYKSQRVDNFIYLNSSVKKGDWLIFNPGTWSTQIRQVENVISATSVALNSPLNLDLQINCDIYIQSTPCWDIKLFGAGEENSSQDNTVAINAASSDCDFVGGGIVYIPKGTYIITSLKSTDPFYNPSSDGACIDMQAKQNIKFIGEGMGTSIIKLEKNSYLNSNDNVMDTHIFNCIKRGTNINDANYRPIKNIEWYNLTIDGNNNDIYKAITTSEQSHSIRIDGGNGLPGSVTPEIPNVINNIVIENVEFLNSTSDSIFLIFVVNVKIINCKFISPARSGCTIQSTTGNIIIKGNYFFNANDQDIDFEPTGSGKGGTLIKSPTKFLVTENTFIKSLRYSLGITLSGKDVSLVSLATDLNPTDPGPIDSNESYTLSKNILKSIGIYSQNIRNLTLIDNIIISGIDGNEVFQSIKNMEKILIKNNIIINRNKKNTVIYFTPQSGKTVQDVSLIGNTIISGQIYFSNCANVNISNNKIIERNKPYSIGIKYQITITPSSLSTINYGNLSISGNQITGAGRQGIFITSTIGSLKLLENIIIQNNIIEGDDLLYGIQIKRPTSGNKISYWNKITIKNNLIKANKANIDIPFPYIINNNNINDKIIFDSSILTLIATASVTDDFLIQNQGTILKNNMFPANTLYIKNIQSNFKLPVSQTTEFVYNWQGWEPVTEINKQKLFHDVFTKDTTLLKDHKQFVLNTFTNSNFWGQGLSQSLFPTDNYSSWIIDSATNLLGGRIATCTSTIGSGSNNIGPANDRISYMTFDTYTENNCIIKSLFEVNNIGEATSGAGVVFRAYSINSNWRYYLIYGVDLKGYIYLEKVTSNSTFEPIYSTIVDIPDTNNFLLTVILNNEFISIYYNDILLKTISDSYNINITIHGLVYKVPRSISAKIYCSEYKILSI